MTLTVSHAMFPIPIEVTLDNSDEMDVCVNAKSQKRPIQIVIGMSYIESEESDWYAELTRVCFLATMTVMQMSGFVGVQGLAHTPAGYMAWLYSTVHSLVLQAWKEKRTKEAAQQEAT